MNGEEHVYISFRKCVVEDSAPSCFRMLSSGGGFETVSYAGALAAGILNAMMSLGSLIATMTRVRAHEHLQQMQLDDELGMNMLVQSPGLRAQMQKRLSCSFLVITAQGWLKEHGLKSPSLQ